MSRNALRFSHEREASPAWRQQKRSDPGSASAVWAASATQAQVAEALALNASAVRGWKKVSDISSAFELGLLADAFGWDPRELLGIERPRHKLAVAARLREVDGSSEHALARMASLVEVDALLDVRPASGSLRRIGFH